MASSKRAPTREPPTVFESARVASWRCRSGGSDWSWQPAAPAWLPDGCANDLAALLAHTDETHGRKLAKAFTRHTDQPFRLTLPIRTSARTVRWLSIHGQTLDDDTLGGLMQDVTETKRVESALRSELLQHRRAAADAEVITFEASLPTWRMQNIDASVEKLTGYPHETWLKQPDFLRQIVVREDRHRFAPATLLRPNVEQVSFVFRLRRADGRIVNLSAVFRLHSGPGRNLATARGILMVADRDLSLGMTSDDRERHLRVLYDENPAMFFSLAADGVVRSVNKYGAIQLGYRPEELVGMRIADVHLPGHRAQVTDYIARCLNDPGSVHHWETCLTRRDGSDVWVRVAARAIEKDERKEVLIVCEDITETRRLSKQLRYQENFDLLTGLANRQRFEKDLEKAVREAGRGSDQHVLCYLDLDHFKLVNDTAGHDAGDKLLLRVSRLLARHVRGCDLLARLGGDEFGILYRHCDLADATARAGQICVALANDRFEWQEQAFCVTASIGVVDLSSTEGTQSQLLSFADTACFAAKDQGRNRVVAYHADDFEIARRHGEMAWISRLQAAVDNNRFELFCQPIRSLSGAASPGDAIEILLRLPGGEDGHFIQPEAFLRAAENYQLAVRIDQWVCDGVLRFFEPREKTTRQLNMCCINLSSQSLTDVEFLEYLVRRIGRENSVASRLCFEITETGVIANLEQATRFILELQALGCRFALDDFGSGVSSFAYLKALPVDIVKIDGMFVRNIAHDAIDHALVASINDISHAMGKQTIAEYVNDKETLAAVREMGVDYAQGFFLAEPLLLREYFRDAG